MKVIYDTETKKFVAVSRYEEREVVKRAGFRWDPIAQRWWTVDLDAVARLEEYLTPDAKVAWEAARSARDMALAASRAADADIDIPHPEGHSYMPFQRAGIAYALQHPRVLIGDEMGLGKTIQVLGLINADVAMQRVLIVCPLSVAINWQREAERWLVRPARIAVADTKSLPDADVVIVHWAIVARHAHALREREWDLLVLDEAHYMKNPKAARTRAIIGDNRQHLPPLTAKRIVALTGTPIPNRPIEGWPLFHFLAPERFPRWRDYAVRYCNGYQDRWGWHVDGASHLEELQLTLRETVMIRRLKSEVLADLPAKIRQVVIVGAHTAEQRRALRAEAELEARAEMALQEARLQVELAKAEEDDTAYKQAVLALRNARRIAFTEMSQVRHETALAKVPAVVEHLRDVLAEQAKVVVFTHHRDVLTEIRSALESGDEAVHTVTVWGGMGAEERQAAVDAFQGDPNVRVVLATIDAAREGLTLTAAHTAVFAELAWSPGDLNQAEDRIHRIGQRDAAIIQHVILDGSLDAKMAQTILAKQAVIDKALDRHIDVTELHNEEIEEIEEEALGDEELGDVAPSDVALIDVALIKKDESDEIATRSTSRARIAALADLMTKEHVEQVHEGLRALARLDDDHAAERNWLGFSKLDSALGHRLATLPTLTAKQAALGAILLHRYRRQIPEYDIIEQLEQRAHTATKVAESPKASHLR